MGQFVVMLSNYERVDWQVAANMLIDAIGMHPATARKQARTIQGFLADALDRNQAEKLQKTCAARGLGTCVVPQRNMVAIPAPNQVRELWICDDNLWFRRGYSGPRTAVRWDSIVLITACLAKKIDSYRNWQELGEFHEHGFPQFDPPRPRIKERFEESAEFLADIFATSSDKSLVWLRLGSRAISFQEALKLDANMTAGTRLENLRLLMLKVAAKAVNAFVPLETQELLRALPRENRRSRRLRDSEEFGAFNRWTLQKLRIEGHLERA